MVWIFRSDKKKWAVPVYGDGLGRHTKRVIAKTFQGNGVGELIRSSPKSLRANANNFAQGVVDKALNYGIEHLPDLINFAENKLKDLNIGDLIKNKSSKLLEDSRQPIKNTLNSVLMGNGRRMKGKGIGLIANKARIPY